MATYILDTNIVSYLERTSSSFHKSVHQRLQSLSDNDEVCISILTIYEFEHSFSFISEPSDLERISRFSDLIKKRFRIIPLTEDGAPYFSEIKKGYKNRFGGNDKALERHNIDFMLAGSAMCEKAIFVSHDKIFRDIHSLSSTFLFEDWAL
jgi:predicted nucleic acid-binding protein